MIVRELLPEMVFILGEDYPVLGQVDVETVDRIPARSALDGSDQPARQPFRWPAGETVDQFDEQTVALLLSDLACRQPALGDPRC